MRQRWLVIVAVSGTKQKSDFFDFEQFKTIITTISFGHIILFETSKRNNLIIKNT